MFKKLVSPEGERVVIRFDGREISAIAGENLAATLLQAGEHQWRTTAKGAQRGPYCLMGSCYECLVTIDGVNRQACQLVVKPGLEVSRVVRPLDLHAEQRTDD